MAEKLINLFLLASIAASFSLDIYPPRSPYSKAHTQNTKVHMPPQIVNRMILVAKKDKIANGTISCSYRPLLVSSPCPTMFSTSWIPISLAAIAPTAPCASGSATSSASSGALAFPGQSPRRSNPRPRIDCCTLDLILSCPLDRPLLSSRLTTCSQATCSSPS